MKSTETEGRKKTEKKIRKRERGELNKELKKAKKM